MHKLIKNSEGKDFPFPIPELKFHEIASCKSSISSSEMITCDLRKIVSAKHKKKLLKQITIKPRLKYKFTWRNVWRSKAELHTEGWEVQDRARPLGLPSLESQRALHASLPPLMATRERPGPSFFFPFLLFLRCLIWSRLQGKTRFLVAANTCTDFKGFLLFFLSFLFFSSWGKLETASFMKVVLDGKGWQRWRRFLLPRWRLSLVLWAAESGEKATE